MIYLFNNFLDFFRKIAQGVASEMLEGIINAIPQLTAALLVLLFGYWIARMVRKILRKALGALQIDRIVDRLNQIDLVQRTGVDIKLSAIMAQAVYYVMMLIFIIAATDVLGIQTVTDMVTQILNYIPSLFSAAVVFFLGLFLADILRNIALTALQSMGIPSAKLIASVIFYFLFITIAVSALSQARISTGFIASNLTVVIGAGALAFAVGYGMASRDLVANYLASYYNRNKVRIGDEVKIGQTKGKVVLIDNTSMILQTTDRAIIIPLSKLTTESVEVFYPDGQEDNLLKDGK